MERIKEVYLFCGRDENRRNRCVKRGKGMIYDTCWGKDGLGRSRTDYVGKREIRRERTVSLLWNW